MNYGTAVKLWPGSLLGYRFAWIQEAGRREQFMALFKASIPMKMWDPEAKCWWVPDLYAHIVEAIALEHGALTRTQVERGKQLTNAVLHNAQDAHGTLQHEYARQLGLTLGRNFRPGLLEAAWAFWQRELADSSSALALEEKHKAYLALRVRLDGLEQEMPV